MAIEGMLDFFHNELFDKLAESNLPTLEEIREQKRQKFQRRKANR